MTEKRRFSHLESQKKTADAVCFFAGRIFAFGKNRLFSREGAGFLQSARKASIIQVLYERLWLSWCVAPASGKR